MSRRLPPGPSNARTTSSLSTSGSINRPDGSRTAAPFTAARLPGSAAASISGRQSTSSESARAIASDPVEISAPASPSFAFEAPGALSPEKVYEVRASI